MSSENGKKLELLAKKSRIERLANLSEYTRISKILIQRESKVLQIEELMKVTEKKMSVLQRQLGTSAEFGGSGFLFKKYNNKSEQLKKEYQVLEEEKHRLSEDLKKAVVRHEEARELYARSEMKSSRLEDRSTLERLYEGEQRAYVEEVNQSDLKSKNSVKSKKDRRAS